MYQYKGISYYGKKGFDYVERLLPLLSVPKLTHLVEAAMGSGVLSANLSFAGIKQSAYELDKGVFILNRQIQSHPYELLDLLREMPYNKDFFDESLEILKQYNATGVSNLSELEIAQREYAILTMSFNSMRTSYRRLDGYTKYSDGNRQRKSKMELERLRNNIYRDISEVVIGCNQAWRNLNIVCDDFINHPEVFIEGKETLVMVDPPYMLSKRGIEGRKSSTGYMADWDEHQHFRFLNFAKQMNEKTNHSRMMICSNFRLNPNGEIDLKEIQDDLYARCLLKIGFRMVVVQKKFSSEIKRWQSDTSHKQAKVEVVYINYTDILGSWYDFEHYDYKDVYGDKCGQELVV